MVKFDIDEGQVMEFCHPPDVFDDAQARDISYLALPDSALAAAALPSPLLCRVACGGPSVGAPGRRHTDVGNAGQFTLRLDQPFSKRAGRNSNGLWFPEAGG